MNWAMTVYAMNEQNHEGRDDDKRHRSEMHRRQRGKNIALALVLAGLVALFYVVAIVRMGGG